MSERVTVFRNMVKEQFRLIPFILKMEKLIKVY
jgi:hypothetical protein